MPVHALQCPVSGQLGSAVKNVKVGNLATKVGRGGGLAGIAMAVEGLFTSPETLGDLIPEESDWRLDKIFNKHLGTGLSEDAEGKFKSVGYGDELADMMGDESYKHGLIAKLYGGEATGTGGGAGDARGGRGNIIVNIGTVNENADALVISKTISNELAKQNKRSHKF